MMLAVKLELPSKPYPEILQGIRICNEKRRSSQPLGQKSAGCIFKNPPGVSAGRMIDELGRSEEHTSELQSHSDLVCRLLLEKKKKKKQKVYKLNRMSI